MPIDSIAAEHAYESWPLGRIPLEHQRPELEAIKRLGYDWKDPWDVVALFERKVAEFAGSKYAVAVDCCSHGLALALKYLNPDGHSQVVSIPKRTYVSVPMQIIHAGCTPYFRNEDWSGAYQLLPYPIYDAAVRWTEGMFTEQGGIQVVSFQLKKRIPIGRGGMVLTDKPHIAQWIRRAAYDGRTLTSPYPEDAISEIGWHYYMTPEDAARGLILMDNTARRNVDSACASNYTDLSALPCFARYGKDQ